VKILSIDPGTDQSAWVLYDTDTRAVLNHGKENNADMIFHFADTYYGAYDAVVIEMVAGYGKPVGAEIFETAVWIGRFMEACPLGLQGVHRVFRREVKRHLCGSENKVNDAVIRQRIIDLYGPGKEKAIGTTKQRGPLWGLRADEWSALAVAITYAETQLPRTAQ